jgi:hypothetical protein
LAPGFRSPESWTEKPARAAIHMGTIQPAGMTFARAAPVLMRLHRIARLAQAASARELTSRRRKAGLLWGDAIIWPDGARTQPVPHPGVITGNKSSVTVGPI